MMPLGLSKSDARAYNRAVVQSRRMYIRARVFDQNEKPIADLTTPTSTILEGQVVIDASPRDSKNLDVPEVPVWRSLNLSILDPRHRLYLDPDSPSNTAMFPSQFISVVRYDYVSELSRFVACPLFFGPLTRFDRQGNAAYVEAMGKEIFNIAPAVMWESIKLPKGMKITDAIKTLLQKNGERKFLLPTLSARLPASISLSRHDQAWYHARRLAASVGYMLFYDGLGRVRMRKKPLSPTWTFSLYERTGIPKPHVLTEPSISYEFSELRNTIEVLGPEPSKNSGKKRIRAVAYPVRSDPLSPWSLSHNGDPRYLVETIENPDIKRLSQAQEIAKDTLADRMNLAREVSFDALPIPHLEEQDYVVLRMADDVITWRLNRFTIPLTSDGVMNLGITRRNRVQRRRRKQRPT